MDEYLNEEHKNAEFSVNLTVHFIDFLLNFFLLLRFMPSFLRLGSWNVVMFVTYEQLKRALMVANHKYISTLQS